VAERVRMLTGKVVYDAVSFLGQDDAVLSYKMVDDLPFDYPHSSSFAKLLHIDSEQYSWSIASMHCCAALPCESALRLSLKASQMSAAVLRVPASGL
jgi:hypothetical protein